MPQTRRPARVFLCHSSADKPKVRELHRRLVEDGFEPWLDEEDLRPGESWKEAIGNAVRAADFIVVCLSDASMSSAGYVHKEIKQALDVADEQPEGRIFVIPLRLEDCRVPQRLHHLHWVDLFADDGYVRLSRALQDPPHPPHSPHGRLAFPPEPKGRARLAASVLLTRCRLLLKPPLSPTKVVAVAAAVGLSVAGLTWGLEGGLGGRDDRPEANSSATGDVAYDPRIGRGPYRVEGTCAVNHTCVLYERRAPSVTSEKVARLPDRRPLTIACQTRGGSVKAPDGGSSEIWDRLYDRRSGPYVSDYFTTTPGEGVFTRSIPRCPPEKGSAR